MTDDRPDAIPFSVDIGRMIELLASQIYPSPFALLRENVQNAFDAVMIRRHAGQPFEAHIDVTVEPGLIRVSDNGIGMSRHELREHFWRAGSSSKNTDDARAAGVVGTFGIGAMANFGIAARLEVVSESARTPERTRCVAERATLSVYDDCISFVEEQATGEPGSIITATMQAGKTIDVAQAVAYITEFVRFVDLRICVNGVLVSQTPIERAVPDLVATWNWAGTGVPLGARLAADVSLEGGATGEVRMDVSRISLEGRPIAGRLVLRQGAGAIRTFRNRFGLAAASIPSAYQLGGVADFLLLQPTAGREALTTESLQFLNLFAAPLDSLVSERLAQRPEANANQGFINWIASHRRWDWCGQLRASVSPGGSDTLASLADASRSRGLLVYGGHDARTMQYASVDRPVVQLARNQQRRQCEQGYLAPPRAEMTMITDEPKVLERLDEADYDLAQAALVFRLTEILNADYFLRVAFGFGKISHDLPVFVGGSDPVSIVLDPVATNVVVILQVYEKEYGAFVHLAKDFVRTVIFPRVSNLVPSATRQGTEAFLKSLQRTRDVFEYERSDLEDLTGLWKDYLDGKLSKDQANSQAARIRRNLQYLDPAATGRIRDVVPDIVGDATPSPPATDEQGLTEDGPDLGALPPIQRTDIATDRKLLVIDEPDPPLKGYRCFLAVSKRVRQERGEFFLQPHRTSVVWGGQKALFIFEHHSGEVGLYYDVQMREPLSAAPGGGSYETCTIVMKDQTFIPVPEALRRSFLPEVGERKRLEVRCDLLYIERDR